LYKETIEKTMEVIYLYERNYFWFTCKEK